MALKDYVAKIDRHEGVNFGAFRKALPGDIKADVYRYFRVEPLTDKLSRVTPVDPDVMDRLRGLAIPPKNRIDAAVRHGDSHSYSTSVTYLLVFREGGDSVRPDIAVLKDGMAVVAFPAKRRVVLIENEENFARYQEMLGILSVWYRQEFCLSNTDVVLAAGNRINKRVTVNWLKSLYDEIVCAFDFDLGGLAMYRSMRSFIPRSEFACPRSLEGYERYFCLSPGSNDRLLAAIELAGQFNLGHLADAFYRTRCFMEQEAMLKGASDS